MRRDRNLKVLDVVILHKVDILSGIIFSNERAVVCQSKRSLLFGGIRVRTG